MKRATAPGAGRDRLLTALCFAALFLPAGAHLPFWPVWLAGRGLSPAEAAAWLAAAGPFRILGGLLVPALADRFGAQRPVLAALLAALACAFIAHLAGSMAAIFVLTLAVGFLWSGVWPLAESLALAASDRAGFGYPQARAAGSAAFLAATLACGALLPVFGAGAVLGWVVAGFLLALPLALLHPGGPAVGGAARAPARGMRRMLGSRVFLLAALAAAAAQASHAVLYGLGSLHWRDLGIGAPAIGGLWAVGVAAETALMAFAGGALVRRFGPLGLLALAGAAGLLRWSLMATDPPAPLLWPLQASHALTFAAAHLGLMAFLARALPGGLAASAQGLAVMFAGGLLLAGGMALASLLYPAMGGATYLVGAGLSALSFGLALAAGRLWDGRRLPLGPAQSKLP